MKKNLLKVRYDPARVTPEQLLQAVEKVKVDEVPFKGKIVEGR